MMGACVHSISIDLSQRLPTVVFLVHSAVGISWCRLQKMWRGKLLELPVSVVTLQTLPGLCPIYLKIQGTM